MIFSYLISCIFSFSTKQNVVYIAFLWHMGSILTAVENTEADHQSRNPTTHRKTTIELACVLQSSNNYIVSAKTYDRLSRTSGNLSWTYKSLTQI